jgi:hypothetical protein
MYEMQYQTCLVNISLLCSVQSSSAVRMEMASLPLVTSLAGRRGRATAVIVGSNPTGVMDVCLL